jgi:AAA family ATP:ADP antiporter
VSRILWDVRADERRATAAAFATNFGILAAHTILETARDALFLSKLPAAQLPWMYLVIAAVAVWLPLGPPRGGGGRRSLSMVLGLCSVGTFLFWTFGRTEGPWALRALYVWTGLVSSVATVQFWVLMNEIFTITQAKRLYGVIGLGSLLGAVAGGVLARFLSLGLPPRILLLASAVTLAATALGPAMLVGRRPPGVDRASAEEVDSPSALRAITSHPYLVRLAALLVIATVAVTVADYLFKSAVARRVAPENLASFFAVFYTLLNGTALLAQMFLAGWLLRVLGLHRALWTLPALLGLGALAVATGGGLAAALVMKGSDGALRPSVDKVGTEMLFLAIPDRLRALSKPLTDVLGRRGGQAVASLFILGELAQHRGEGRLAVVAVILCGLWMASVADLKPHYLEMFRSALRDRSFRRSPELPELDLSALEALFAALNSGDDAEVHGALELLAEEGRTGLIPALILYHPSRSVVFQALALFTDSGRTDFVPIADRLLTSPDAEIRAAALRARSVVQRDEVVLRGALFDPSPGVRATAVVGLMAAGLESDESSRALHGLLDHPSVETQIGLVRAIERQPAAAFEDTLLSLAESQDEEVLRHVVHAMGRIRSPRFPPRLLGLLGRQSLSAEVRQALVDHGDQALSVLQDALADEAAPKAVRRNVPKALSQFSAESAAPILTQRLLIEGDGMVRFRIIRSLGRLASAHPGYAMDRGPIGEAVQRTVDAAVDLLSWRVSLLQGAAREPRRATAGHELLTALLRDKEVHAVERAFRLLALIQPQEDLRAIHRGLRNSNAKIRAGSRELLEHVLPPNLRTRILALVDDAPEEARLAQLQRAAVAYDEVLAAFLESSSQTVRSLATYHAGELRSLVAP